MKTSVLKSIVIFIVVNIFNVSINATGLYFTVEIPSSVNANKIEDYPVKLIGSKIFVGEFKDYLVAMKAKQTIDKKCHLKGVIQAFFNKNEISLDDAFTLIENRNSQDERIVHSLTEDDMERMLKNVQNHDFFYTVQMGVFTEKNVESFYKFPKSIDERITSKGHFRYTFGQFKTLQDAKDALRMVKENGLDQAIIIAYDELDRIPLVRAIEKEKQLLNEALAMAK